MHEAESFFRRSPPVPIVQEAGWTQRLEEKSFAPAGDRTSIVQSVARHYTAWATLAPGQTNTSRLSNHRFHYFSICSEKGPVADSGPQTIPPAPFPKIHFPITPSSVPWAFEWINSFMLSHQNFIWIYHFFACYMPCPSYPCHYIYFPVIGSLF
jgi:hypothetical protein